MEWVEVDEMNTQEAYITDWKGVPSEDGLAEPTARRSVSNATVIHVSRASIRASVVEDVYFELAPVKKPYGSYAGKPRAEVKCLWYGRKPLTTWMHITLLGPHTEHRDFTGEVVWDIGQLRK